MISPEMADRIAAYIKASIDSKRAGGIHWMRDPFKVFLMEFIAGAEDDTAAANLMRLADDWDARDNESALATVFAGRVDLVALLRGEKKDA